MKLNFFFLACMGIIIIVDVLSGELIPGSVQGPRIRRESVHHVPSVIGLNPTPSSFQILGRNNQHARHVRTTYGTPLSAEDTSSRPPDFAIFELNRFPIVGHAKAIVMSTGEDASGVEVYPPGNLGDVHVLEKSGKPVAFHPGPGETPYGQRRRRAESFQSGRQISRAPSGFRRQPIRRSVVPRNLSDPGLTL